MLTVTTGSLELFVTFLESIIATVTIVLYAE